MDSANGSASHYNDTPWFLLECTVRLDRDSRRIALFLLYLLLFMAGLAENGVVLWVNWRRRRSASAVLFCVLNVTASDAMVVLVMPFFMLEVMMDKVWLWGRFFCKVTHLVYCVNFYSSSFFLAYMTLERYRALARPPSPGTQAGGGAERRRRALACGGLWALALLLALLENVHVDLLEWNEPGCYMMPEYSYVEWFTTVTFLCLLFQFLGPATVIVTCNVLIARAARAAPDVQGGRRDVWLVHVYSLVFVACWLPYHLVLFLMMVDDLDPRLLSCNAVEVLYFSFSVVQAVSLAHCVANPILYNFLSKSFRANLANAVLERVLRPSAAGDQGRGANQAGGGGAGGGPKERKLSDTSTSHSDVPS
ncbi:G-protein coupled receptor 182 [Anguilla rostrata]|uniref:G-protein coupled receptor 182 n=1 Tax=Anguilla rostrata TaxID=7938 RepID=UPI0030CC12A0